MLCRFFIVQKLPGTHGTFFSEWYHPQLSTPEYSEKIVVMSYKLDGENASAKKKRICPEQRISSVLNSVDISLRKSWQNFKEQMHIYIFFLFLIRVIPMWWLYLFTWSYWKGKLCYYLHFVCTSCYMLFSALSEVTFLYRNQKWDAFLHFFVFHIFFSRRTIRTHILCLFLLFLRSDLRKRNVFLETSFPTWIISPYTRPCFAVLTSWSFYFHCFALHPDKMESSLDVWACSILLL